jgi:hypothetical protein
LTVNRGNAADTLSIDNATNLTSALTVGTAVDRFANVTFSNGFVNLGSNTATIRSQGATVFGGAGLAAGTVDISGTVNVSVFGNVTGGAGGVTIVGGGASPIGSPGVAVQTGGLVSTTGGGAINITGTGGILGGPGVYVDNAAIQTPLAGGNITVVGQGGGSGASSGNHGVVVVNGGSIAANGAGAVNVTGTGGLGTGGSHFGVLYGGSVLGSASGNLSVTGNAGPSTVLGINAFTGGLGSGGNTSLSSTNSSNILVSGGVTAFFNTLTVNTGGSATVFGSSMATLTGANSIGGNLQLQANGAITQTAGSSLTVTGTTQLSAANPSNNIILEGNNNFVGAVTIMPNSANNVELNDTTGGLVLGGIASPGIAGLLRVTAVGGVSQTGAIQAAGIGVRNSSSGNIDLGTQTNVITGMGHFTANNTAVGGSVSFLNGPAFRVGTIAGGVGFAPTSGITTSNGAVAVNSTGPGIGLEANIASTGGTIAISNPGGDMVLLTNASLTSGGGNITINRGIQADNAANNRTLTINAGAGSATMLNVGTIQPVQALNLTSGTGSSIGAIVARDGGVTINSSSITLNGSISGNGLGGSPGPINITGAVTLGNTLNISSTAGPGGVVTFGAGSSINGAFDLTLSGSSVGVALGNTVIGGVTPLNFLQLFGFDINGSGSINTMAGVAINNGGTSSTLSGNIVGSGSLVKIGSGTMNLTGTNTYAAGTVINQGTLWAMAVSHRAIVRAF